MKETVYLPPTPSLGDYRAAHKRLEAQVEALKGEINDYRAGNASWLYKARAFTRALGVTFGWSGIYFTLLAGTFGGRTVGKLLFGTRVVKINGSPLTYFDAFIRNGGYVAGVAMGLVGFMKLLWEPNRQAVEDRIASTVVIRT